MRSRYFEVLLFALLGVGIASFSPRSEPRAVPVRTGLSVHFRDVVRSRIAPMPRVRWEGPRAPADPVRFGAWPSVSSSADPEAHVQLRTDYGF